MIGFIVKSGDDLRQEQFAMQLVCIFDEMFKRARTRLCLRPYQVVSTAPDAGLIEVLFLSFSLSLSLALSLSLSRCACVDTARSASASASQTVRDFN